MALDDQTKTLIKRHIANRETVYISSDGVPVTFESRILQLSGKNLTLINSVTPEHIFAVTQSKHHSLQIENLKFFSSEIGSDGKNIIFTISDSSQADNIRSEERIRYQDPDSCYCEFLNPFDMQTTLRKPIIDLSGSGVSVRNQTESRLFTPGIQIYNLKVVLDHKQAGMYKGKVIYQRLLMSLKGKTSVQVGIKFM